MPPPIPVTFVLEELNFGGTQKQTLELACRLDRALFSPRIWTVRGGEALLPLAREADIPVTMLRQDATLHPLPAAVALGRALYREKPVLLHLCTAFPNVWGRLLGGLLGCLPGSVRGGPAGFPLMVASCRGQGNVRGQHERFLWRLAHAHICNARSIYEALRALGVPENTVHFIPNGVDTECFAPAPLPVRAPEVVCVGRMVEEKDHKTLLAAFALVQATLPHARLHLVGDGPLLPQVRAQALALGLTESVLFHGASSKVREHLRAARLMVLSSVSEGTPNVLLEAMSTALPVVATDVGGIPDLVRHGEHGLLSMPRDARALADSLLRLLQDDALSLRMGTAGRDFVRRTSSLEALARGHERIYLDLCRKAGLTR